MDKKDAIAIRLRDIKKIYKEKYTGPIVSYVENSDENGFIAANRFAGKDGMEISVAGNDERILLISRYDNLGKGASGAAVQCLGLMLGLRLETRLAGAAAAANDADGHGFGETPPPVAAE